MDFIDMLEQMVDDLTVETFINAPGTRITAALRDEMEDAGMTPKEAEMFAVRADIEVSGEFHPVELERVVKAARKMARTVYDAMRHEGYHHEAIVYAAKNISISIEGN